MSAPGTSVYRERLWPGPILWIGAGGCIGVLAIAYAAALGAFAGWAVAIGGWTVAAVLIVRSAAVVSVDARGLLAGRARIGWQSTGRVLALDAAQTASARGPAGDASAYLLLRPGVGPGSVLVEVTDPSDPHRTWLIASRHPERMARAIEAARGRVAP